MSRRFNFTGRAKILKEDIKVIIEARGNTTICNVHLRLGAYQLKPDATVIVEAERGRVLRHRYKWGLAGQAFLPEGLGSEFDISAMGDLEDVRFRVLVVEPESCKLLAAAEGVEAYNKDDTQEPQRSLLPIVMRDLHGGIWELEDMDGTPTLVLDYKLGTKHELKSSPVLSAILPGVVRAILVYQALERQEEDADEDTGECASSTLWLQMGGNWAGCPCPATTDYRDVDEWAQKAVTGFCVEKKLRNRLSNFMSQED